MSHLVNMKTTTSCLMSDPGLAACCCTCRFHLPDHSHSLTDGGRLVDQRGWICMPPEFECAFSGWPEHGLCEMWETERAYHLRMATADPSPAVKVRMAELRAEMREVQQ